ncbi:LysR family transcriptional regulator [Novosphingobium sp. FKTRR1]|uniref:LysR family transcriptional regulator n=1 Tax=Novosphingobium sp. FKTRR1 TaxID=2879118 RepID=UPI001CF087B2|nr:LysR family transcriptional regulator [Novosphingobium sp. FKTRR1]
MSLVHLRTFIEVYRQRSISGAARGLGLTQPAVSQHIAALEAAVGRQLFLRSVHGMAPTPAADELAADIGDRLDLAEAALGAARARSSEMAGAVRLVGHADFLSEVIAPLLIPLLMAQMKVRLQAGDRDDVIHNLAEGHCDLGLSGYPIQDRRLRTELVREEPVIAVAAPAIAARLRTAPDLATALAAEPLLAYNLERMLVDGWLAHNGLQGVTPNPAVIGQDFRGLRRLLCAGFGWTAMPAYLCRAEIARGDLEEIPGPVGPTANAYYMVWAAGALRHPRIAHVRQTLMAELRRGV